jgi:hypothetical protein
VAIKVVAWKPSFAKGMAADMGTTELQWLGRSASNAGMEECPQQYRGLADIEVGVTALNR